MKVIIHEGNKEEVEAAHNTLESMTHLRVKAGQYKPIATENGVVHYLMDWYEYINEGKQ